MRITAAEMDARGACGYQLDLFVKLFGDGANADNAMGLAGAQAGLDLDWIDRHFLPYPDAIAAFEAAKDKADAAMESAKSALLDTADKAKLAIPTEAPVVAIDTALSVGLGKLEVGEALDVTSPIKASAFSAAFVGR